MKLTTINKPIKENKDFVKLVETGDYFKQMDYAIQNSPTATMVVLMFKKYCVLPNLKEKYLNLWEKIVDEKIKYGFFTLWVEYNLDLKIKDVHFRMSKNYRAKNIDDVNNVSQYLNVKTKKKFPSFNNNQEILRSQIEEKGFEEFSGQIYQYNTTSQPYEITPLFSVLNFMKTEEDTPNHISAIADNSLFGNNIFLMKKGVETEEVTNTDRVLSALQSAKSVKNAGSNYVLTGDFGDEDLTKIFHKIELGNNIDIDKFNLVDEKASKKICMACYCFPQILANPSEGLFGNSGESFIQAINYWKSTCEFEAKKIEDALLKIGINLQNDATNINNGVTGVLPLNQ